MKPLTPPGLRGTWATLLLPITEHEAIDWPRLRADLDYLISSRLHGLYVHGTSGEFFTLTEDEFDRINGLLTERCEAAGMAFQIGASHMSAQVSLQRVRRATEYYPGAIQVILPDWVPLSESAVLTCLRRFAEAAQDVPLVLYNPPHAKTTVTTALYSRLAAEIPSLIGVKVAEGSKVWFEEMRPLAPRLAVFVPGHRMASGMRLGAAGSYSNVACLNPTGARNWYKLILEDPTTALDVERRLRRFFDDYVVPLQRAGYPDHALDKYLAAVGGWATAGTRVRWPYPSLDETEAEQLRPIARKRLPELFPES